MNAPQIASPYDSAARRTASALAKRPRRRARLAAAALALAAGGCFVSTDVDFTITQPEDGEVTSFKAAVVAGQVPSAAYTIWVNKKQIRPNAMGYYQTTVPLEVGKNKVTVEVGDTFRRTRKTVVVRRVRGVEDD